MKIVVDKLLNQVNLLTPTRHHDTRGYFAETYNQNVLSNNGIKENFVQDNHSLSLETGTVRGLHFQSPPYEQAKLIRCVNGSIFDVCVDIRKGSNTFGKWTGYTLTSKNGNQLYIPIGFAHGFMVLEPNSEIIYKCSYFYSPENEGVIFWNDPDINIQWPLQQNHIVNEKDKNAPLLKNLNNPFM